MMMFLKRQEQKPGTMQAVTRTAKTANFSHFTNS